MRNRGGVTSYWWIDRVLPGVAASFVVAAAIGLSHILLRRKINAVTRKQNEHIDAITAQQTATLSGNPETGGDPGEPV
jgi:hypothetical protein